MTKLISKLAGTVFLLFALTSPIAFAENNDIKMVDNPLGSVRIGGGYGFTNSAKLRFNLSGKNVTHTAAATAADSPYSSKAAAKADLEDGAFVDFKRTSGWLVKVEAVRNIASNPERCTNGDIGLMASYSSKKSKDYDTVSDKLKRENITGLVTLGYQLSDDRIGIRGSIGAGVVHAKDEIAFTGKTTTPNGNLFTTQAAAAGNAAKTIGTADVGSSISGWCPAGRAGVELSLQLGKGLSLSTGYGITGYRSQTGKEMNLYVTKTTVTNAADTVTNARPQFKGVYVNEFDLSLKLTF